MNDSLVFGRGDYSCCYVVFLCRRFVWGRIVSVSEGVSGKKSVLLLNALPCANKNMVFGHGAYYLVSSCFFCARVLFAGWYRFCEYRCFR